MRTCISLDFNSQCHISILCMQLKRAIIGESFLDEPMVRHPYGTLDPDSMAPLILGIKGRGGVAPLILMHLWSLDVSVKQCQCLCLFLVQPDIYCCVCLFPVYFRRSIYIFKSLLSSLRFPAKTILFVPRSWGPGKPSFNNYFDTLLAQCFEFSCVLLTILNWVVDQVGR